MPDPQSQPLSQRYESNMPTSLTYVYLSTRDYKPWIPDAVSGTIWTLLGRKAPGCSAFQGPQKIHRTPPNSKCYTRQNSESPDKLVQPQHDGQEAKTTLPAILHGVTELNHTFQFLKSIMRNYTLIPFREIDHALFKRLLFSLRID